MSKKWKLVKYKFSLILFKIIRILGQICKKLKKCIVKNENLLIIYYLFLKINHTKYQKEKKSSNAEYSYY